jgi:hypothetical protein
MLSRGDHFRFGSVFIKKSNQIEFFFKKTETGSNQPVSVRFGFLGKKPVQTGLLGFPVWLGFGSVFFGFGLVRFFAYKTKTEPAGFFKSLIGLIGFFSVRFFRVFFFGFLGLIGFLVFLLTPNAFLFVGLFLPHISNRKLVELT